MKTENPRFVGDFYKQLVRLRKVNPDTIGKKFTLYQEP